MNLIANLLPPSNILLDTQVTSKKRVFEQAGLVFENNQGIARSKVFDSLFARERLGSTGLGQQVAVPHGRIKGLREPVACANLLPRWCGYKTQSLLMRQTANPSSCSCFCWCQKAQTSIIWIYCPNWLKCCLTKISARNS
jgi:hypothetical protein